MTSPENEKQPVQFEQAMARLEAIIAQLDNPQTELEQMIPLVEEGLSLIRSSKELLAQAELRIKVLENPQIPNEQETTQPPAEEASDEFSLR